MSDDDHPPSEILALLDTEERVLVGGMIVALSPELGQMSADAVAAFGAVIAAGGSGWFGREELVDVPADAHVAADLLREVARRVATGRRWAEELDGG